MDLSLFGTNRAPFYVLAPDFRHSSAGVRNLHYLCHTLNELGYEAYIAGASKTSIHLRTPLLDISTMERHFRAGLMPIAVYPEITSGNPMNLTVVTRWLLNIPGHLGGEDRFDANDLIFYHLPWCLPEGLSGQQLYIPSVDTHVFNNDDNPHDSKRSGFCRYAHKFLGFGGKIKAEHETFQSLGHEITLTPQDIASTLRRSEALYCYERSAIIQEATACGCPVICVPSDYWDIKPFEVAEPGIEMDLGPASLSKAQSEIGNAAGKLRDIQAHSIEQIRQFAGLAQAHAQKKSELTTRSSLLAACHQYWQLNTTDRLKYIAAFKYFYASSSFLANTQDLDGGVARGHHQLPLPDIFSQSNTWLSARELIAEDGIAIDKKVGNWTQNPTFQIILRVNDDISLLADTLDSLNTQVWSHWSLDVFSPLTAPEVINEIPIIHWHTVDDPQNTHLAINDICAKSGNRWIIELPPGAILDQLLLWRLADEINQHPETRAFFVDDFITDNGQVCTQLRLKPGVNQAALQSADIAGPIFISREAWLATEGASQSAGSPWFAQLLGIADKFGWNSIKHIPDALISYSGAFPSDTDACLLSLYKNLQSKGIQGDFVPATNQSWNIRYPLTTTPQISIAIISQNQLELLTRCFYSIVEKTSYPNYEILILVADESNDPDMLAWLEKIQKQNTPKTRIIKVDQADSYAARCNIAVKSSSNEFVALIKEDTVVIQAQWLEELVRTCLQEDVAAASPRLIAPGTSKIQNAGSVLGLGGLYGSPYQDLANLGDPGYLDCLQVARDVSILPAACMLVRTANYLAVSGMDDSSLGNYFAEADLCLKLRKQNQRLIYQPLSTLVDGGSRPLDIAGDFAPHLHEELAKAKATETFTNRWLTNATVDPFWNPNLSLVDLEPTPETSFHPQWQYLPTDAPRILTRPLSGAQATYRITSPLHALRKAGMASECIWPMGGERDLTPAELVRLAPDSVIVQQYTYDHHLAALQAWQSLPNRPFTVYSLDDLITQMAGSNPFIKNFPSNSRTRLKYALDRCDRLVVPTNTLAEMSQSFISDIQVVPNRLEQDVWLPLHSKKRTGSKPRIGWAGGSSHQVDLILLKEVIEQTRDEADWIFFGMCPEEIRPLLSEFHGLQALSEYPKKLASLNLDIAVAPLAQIPFNQAKSNLRLLEYGALAIPVVCTDIDPYRGSPACCVSNTAEAWVAALRERIHAPDAREQEGIALRSWVHQNFLLEDGLEVWLTAHTKAN